MQLALGIPQTATLQLRNTGVPVTATVQLFVQSPQGGEILLVEQALVLEPFETGFVSDAITATQSGVYRVRGRVTAQSPADHNPHNNEFVWEIPARLPGNLTPNANTLHFSSPLDAHAQGALRLKNQGEQGVIIHEVALVHQPEESAGFVLWHDRCTDVGLSPGEQCAVTIRFEPVPDGMRHARVEVTSTDPNQPVVTVALVGQVGALQEPDEEEAGAGKLYLPQLER